MKIILTAIEYEILKYIQQRGIIKTDLRERSTGTHEGVHVESFDIISKLGIQEHEVIKILHSLKDNGILHFKSDVHRFDPSEYFYIWKIASNININDFVTYSNIINYNIENSIILKVLDILKQDKHLSILHWKDFEKLICNLLTAENWQVQHIGKPHDNGVDIEAKFSDDTLGEIISLWQAKKYKSTHKVEVHHARELSGVADRYRATKAFLVTTSQLTRDAKSWIQDDKYRLGYKEHTDIVKWINRVKP